MGQGLRGGKERIRGVIQTEENDKRMLCWYAIGI